MGISPTGGCNGGGRIAGGGYLHLPPPEQSCTVYCYQAHYGPVSVSGSGAGMKGGQAVVGAGRTGFGGDANRGLGGGTDKWGGGYGQDRDQDGDRFNQWQDNAAHMNLGTETNDTLDYAPLL